jgi:carbon monoxide dehydrogenase subunit G
MSRRAPVLPPDQRSTAPPVLGDACVPGCASVDVDGDGAHMCLVRVATVPVRHQVTGEPSTIVAEVLQQQDTNGTLTRRVGLLPLDRFGRYHGDGVEVDAADAGELLAAVARAIGTAGGAW